MDDGGQRRPAARLIGLQRLLCSPAPVPRRTELSVATVALTGSAVLAADEDRVAQAA